MLAKRKPTDADKEAWIAFTWKRCWMFDVQGTAKAEAILETFEYAYKRYGVTHFLIDSLAKCGIAEDDYGKQKDFVDRLSDFARNNDVQVHLVCHTRKGVTEADTPGKFDIKGTGALTDMVDNVFTVWRNKPKEEKVEAYMESSFFGGASPEQEKEYQDVAKEHDCLLSCVKSREGEWEGQIALWFDRDSLQYLEYHDSKPIRYC